MLPNPTQVTLITRLRKPVLSTRKSSRNNSADLGAAHTMSITRREAVKSMGRTLHLPGKLNTLNNRTFD
jgi:hypothetical protein